MFGASGGLCSMIVAFPGYFFHILPFCYPANGSLLKTGLILNGKNVFNF